jgi:hypothetical protein
MGMALTGQLSDLLDPDQLVRGVPTSGPRQLLSNAPALLHPVSVLAVNEADWSESRGNRTGVPRLLAIEKIGLHRALAFDVKLAAGLEAERIA